MISTAGMVRSICTRYVVKTGSLIIVMDEIAHTPEFFFINRNGWHSFSDPLLNRDDTPDRGIRSRGATVYFGLTEHRRIINQHLYEHVVGRYLFPIM